MRTGYERVSERQDLLRRAAELSAKTIVYDVEPLVTFWDSNQESLDRGLAGVLDQVAAVPGVQVVCFATNSARRPSAIPAAAGIRVMYLSSAQKPIRIAPYQDLPRPGAVIGDQVATDGVLARRLGYTFLYYFPLIPDAPIGPRLLHQCGQFVLPLLFRSEGVRLSPVNPAAPAVMPRTATACQPRRPPSAGPRSRPASARARVSQDESA